MLCAPAMRVTALSNDVCFVTLNDGLREPGPVRSFAPTVGKPMLKP